MDAAVPSFALFPSFQFPLYLLEHIRADDGFVVAFHIVLRDFTLIGLFLLGEEVNRVGLLPCNDTLDTIIRLQQGGS